MNHTRSRHHRHAAHLPSALCIGIASLMWGCTPTEQPHKSPYDGPALNVPQASARDAEKASEWTEQLPQVDVDYALDTRVWAAVARTGGRVDVAVYRVVSHYDNAVSLLDQQGQRIDGVPTALVHRAAPLGKLRIGDEVLCDAAGAPGVLARVSRLDGNIRVTYGWNERLQETVVDHAEPPREGITPMAYVRYQRGHNEALGLVLALSDTSVWLRDGSGQAVRVNRDAAAPTRTPQELKVGDTVSAFQWQNGLQSVQIDAIVTPLLNYDVRLADGSQTRVFFAQLVAPARP